MSNTGLSIVDKLYENKNKIIIYAGVFSIVVIIGYMYYKKKFIFKEGLSDQSQVINDENIDEFDIPDNIDETKLTDDELCHVDDVGNTSEDVEISNHCQEVIDNENKTRDIDEVQ
jgi:hypothetical protein